MLTFQYKNVAKLLHNKNCNILIKGQLLLFSDDWKIIKNRYCFFDSGSDFILIRKQINYQNNILQSAFVVY